MMFNRNLIKALKELSNSSLHEKTKLIARKEQDLGIELLYHLHEVKSRKLYAELSYSTLWEYVTEALGYDGPTASIKTRAMELMFSSTEAREQIESKKMSIHKAAVIQQYIRKEKPQIKQSETKDLLKELETKSVRETREALKTLAGDSQCLFSEQHGKTVSFTANQELLALMERVRELKGNLELSQMMQMVFSEYLKRIDPILKPTKPRKPIVVTSQRNEQTNPGEIMATAQEKNSRYIPVQVRAEVAKRSGGRCEWEDSHSGRRCSSRYRLQYDHILEYCRGGQATIENIQHLCFQHNQLRAMHLMKELRITAGIGG